MTLNHNEASVTAGAVGGLLAFREVVAPVIERVGMSVITAVLAGVAMKCLSLAFEWMASKFRK